MKNLKYMVEKLGYTSNLSKMRGWERLISANRCGLGGVGDIEVFVRFRTKYGLKIKTIGRLVKKKQRQINRGAGV